MNSATTAAFGNLLRHYRHAAGLTQQDLAERAGLASRAISDLERGARNRPYRDTVIRLANALDVPEPVRSEFFAAARRVVSTSTTDASADASEPIRLVPDLRSSSGSEISHNLPVPLSSFVGRERKMTEVRRLLVGPASMGRLLTLTGPPGVGKTRLALEVALDLVGDFADGIVFVPLAAIADPNLVVPAIAHGCRFEGFWGPDLIERLSQMLRGKRTLLLLDNFEQVAAAAPLVAQLLENCPSLKALITSRSRLHVRGERELAIPPLPVPDPTRDSLGSVDLVSSVLQSASVQLFVERARDARSDFALSNENAPVVAEICRRLDGLPLAIELAAGRGKVLSPEAILDHLRDRFQLLTSGPADVPIRQQTLHQAIAWSYDLLNPSEQQLFRQLAVFVGGFTLQSASLLVAEDPEAPDDVLRGVETLVDRSLVDPVEDGARFRMLETLRAYGLERLAASGELETLHRRHAACFRAMAEDAAAHFWGPHEGEWIDILEREHDNLRAALRFLIDSGDIDQAFRLGSHLRWFWKIHQNFNDARVWLEELLALTERSTNTVIRARVLMMTAHAAFQLSNYPVARVRTTEALAISRGIGDRERTANSLALLGLVARDQGDYDQARTWFKESLEIWRDLGDRAAIGAQLDRIGMVDFYQGDHVAACALLEESLEIRRTLDDRGWLGWALHELGRVRHGLGETATARSLFDESLAVWRQQGYSQGIAYVLASLGDLALDRADRVAACPFLVESLGLFRDLGQPLEVARGLELFAGLAAARNHSERALRVAAAADAIRMTIGAPIPPDYKARLERRLAGARQELGEQGAATARAAGQAMTLEQAVEYALEDSRT